MARLKNQLDKCVDLMGTGSRLMNMTKPDGSLGWFLVPGKEVPPEIARLLIARPDVFPQKDALFPGMSQTYRRGIK